jgi:tRNA modification GTPase
MYADDTIAAISTPPGRGGIGVMRLSGPASLDIAASIFHSKSEAQLDTPNRAHFGHLIDPATGEIVDEVILTFFKAPHSYTGEDVAEISCHGSPIILQRVLQLAIDRRARIAEPGEFTFRAFLNKRIDLTQAQAVRDVINAQTQYQARVATKQLEGELSRRLKPLKDTLVEVIVHLESSLEFVEEDISPQTTSILLTKLQLVIDALCAIADSFSFGRYLREGFDLAIVGRPNVGKSSVFNRLIGSDRAIVTELPGTTRDALYESTSISGVPVRLIDTAGIRETTDLVESLGITRSRTVIADADISLLVLDASEPLTGDDVNLLNHLSQERRMIAVNKTDLPNKIETNSIQAGGGEVINISALTGNGFDLLTRKILGQLAGDAAMERDDIMLTDARQHAAVRNAIEQLGDASKMMRSRELEEIVLLKLRSALSAFGEITGETLNDDILGQIFSTFCIGK